MPSVFGKDNKKKELVNNLAEIYGRIEREHQISPGDFPNLKRMQVTPGHRDSEQPEYGGGHTGKCPRSVLLGAVTGLAGVIPGAGEKRGSPAILVG